MKPYAFLLLAALAVAVGLSPAPLVPGARAETEADVPRDPDFYYPYDPLKHDWAPVSRPDLTKRPRPRDSRSLTGTFAPDAQGTLRAFTVGGTATSPCIAEPVSALCAIETLIAGGMTGDTRLEKIAFGPFARHYVFVDRKQMKYAQPRKGEIQIYRAYDVKRLGPDDLKGPRPYGVDPWYPRWYQPHLAWQVGDLQIQILSMACPNLSAQKCSSDRIPTTTTVREIAPNHWAVVSSYRARF